MDEKRGSNAKRTVEKGENIRLTVQNELKTVDCPHCKKGFELEIERRPSKLVIEERETIKEVPKREEDLAKLVDDIVEKRFLKPKEKQAPTLEKHVPGYRCKNCGNVHENKNYSERPKGKCTNCGQFSNVKSGPCPWCKDGELDEVDQSELDDLGIITPLEKPEHDHDHE